MKKIKTKFKDLFVVKAKIFKDKRGWLKEEFKKERFTRFTYADKKTAR